MRWVCVGSRRDAGQAARAGRPCCVGPSGCPAVLSHTEGIAQPAPFARLGVGIRYIDLQNMKGKAMKNSTPCSQARANTLQRFLLCLYEHSAHIPRGLESYSIGEMVRISYSVLPSALR